ASGNVINLDDAAIRPSPGDYMWEDPEPEAKASRPAPAIGSMSQANAAHGMDATTAKSPLDDTYKEANANRANDEKESYERRPLPNMPETSTRNANLPPEGGGPTV